MLKNAVAFPLADMGGPGQISGGYFFAVAFLEQGQHLFDPPVLRGVIGQFPVFLGHGPGVDGLPHLGKKVSDAQLKKGFSLHAEIPASA